MRTAHQPLAHLVDAAAQSWLAAERASDPERRAVRSEIVRAFNIGDKAELTFHGLRYLLTITHCADTDPSCEPGIEVHEITRSN